jgi:lipid II:glycine glycyltransferase (peptidoglycan interpeptide bridge formation enzyme)
MDGSLKVYSPAPRNVWREILNHDPDALLFQTPEWLDCICAYGPFRDTSRLYEMPGGKRLVLPLVKGVTGTESSLPHGWGMGGLVMDGQPEEEEVAAIFQDLIDHHSLSISLRPNPLQMDLYRAAAPAGIRRQPRSTHILSLEGGFDRVWSERFRSETRTKIRKAEKSGLVIEHDTSGRLLPVFYEVYLDWIERRARERKMPLALARMLGKWRDPYRKFETVARVLGGTFHVWVARLDEKPVAASLQLITKEHAIFWRNASNKHYATLTRANEFLHRNMIEAACNAGCRTYHMGESGGVESLMRFKEHFGAVEYRYEEYSIGMLPVTSLQQWAGNLVKQIEKRVLAREREKAV